VGVLRFTVPRLDLVFMQANLYGRLGHPSSNPAAEGAAEVGGHLVVALLAFRGFPSVRLEHADTQRMVCIGTRQQYNKFIEPSLICH
jgi:hypothetical protein